MASQSQINQTQLLKWDNQLIPNKLKRFTTTSNISLPSNTLSKNRNSLNIYIDSQLKSIHTQNKEDTLYIKKLKQNKEALTKKNKETQAELIIEKAYSINKNNTIRSYDFNKNNNKIGQNNKEVMLPKISVKKMKEKLIEEAERLFPDHYYENNKHNHNVNTNRNCSSSNTTSVQCHSLSETPKNFQLKYLKDPYSHKMIYKKVEDKYKSDYDKYHVVKIKLNFNKDIITNNN